MKKLISQVEKLMRGPQEVREGQELWLSEQLGPLVPGFYNVTKCHSRGLVLLSFDGLEVGVRPEYLSMFYDLEQACEIMKTQIDETLNFIIMRNKAN